MGNKGKRVNAARDELRPPVGKIRQRNFARKKGKFCVDQRGGAAAHCVSRMGHTLHLVDPERRGTRVPGDRSDKGPCGIEAKMPCFRGNGRGENGYDRGDRGDALRRISLRTEPALRDRIAEVLPAAQGRLSSDQTTRCSRGRKAAGDGKGQGPGSGACRSQMVRCRGRLWDGSGRGNKIWSGQR